MFHMNFAKIAEFDRLPVRHKKVNFGKIFKSFLLRNIKGANWFP